MFSMFSKYAAKLHVQNSEASKHLRSLSGDTFRKTTASASSAAVDDKSSAQVALAARKFLDTGYRRLGAVADEHTTEKDWHETVQIQKLDRRALYAIVSDQGGLFSGSEIKAAKVEVARRYTQATNAANPRGNNPAAAAKAAIDMLDYAGPEEKASLEWAEQRASAQSQYHDMTNGRPAKRISAEIETKDPVVDLFVKAWSELSAARSYAPQDTTIDVKDMPSWSKAISLWKILSDHPSKTIGHL